MKISFDNSGLKELSNAKTYTNNGSAEVIKGIGSSYEISKSLKENNTYEGAKASLSEFRDSLKGIDIKNTQDYMTVMSNCMSDEDFAKLVKEGGKPGSVEVKDAVTIVDEIKLAVAKSGKDIKGFTDTLDSDTLEAMTGLKNIDLAAKEQDITFNEDICEDIKEAVDMLEDIDEITDGMKKFFVSSDAPVTIENLYLSKHSVMEETKEQGSGYFAIETKGYLAKKGEALSPADLEKEIKELLKDSMTEVSEENVGAASWLVKNSIEVNKNNIDKLNEINGISLPLSDGKISKVVAIAVAEGKNPKDADITKEESIYEQAVRLTKEIEKTIDSPFVKATRIREEIRLKMTTEANLLLLRSNVKIDTKDLEAYVEGLKNVENLEEYKEVKEVIAVQDKILAVKGLPAQIIAPIAPSIGSIKLDEIIEIGTPVKERYKQAGLAYEEMFTEVRKDLGDSIKKAFRNVPDILNEMGLEDTKENERAVRILGYNSMEINKENIDEVKEADRKLQMILTRLTPADTLKLIRKGNSPIKMSVDELNEYLDETHDSKEEEIEKYSKFLYKLERTNNITQSERKQFIEVYRFFHKMEKTEDAAIGAILGANQELTIPNLKTAMKTIKHKGMDVTIGEVYDTLVNDTDEALEKSWTLEKYHEMTEALKAPEETVTELVENEVPVTAEHLEAALLLRKERGKAIRNALKANEGSAKEKALSVREGFENKEDTVKDYKEFCDVSKEAVYEEAIKSDNYLDVRALQLVNMQLNVAKAYAEVENFEVPVEVGGQVTSVNVKLVHNSKEDPNVVISMETEELGRVSARLSYEREEITGYIACNLKESVSKLQKVADKLSTKVSVVLSSKSDTPLNLSRIPMRENSEEVSSKVLYGIAKKFLQEMKGNL